MSKIMIVAGEASGDNHGAMLIQALKKIHPDTDCYGIGSQKMKKAGCRLLFDAKTIAVVGLVEVLRHYPQIKKAWNIALESLKTEKPDCVVLIDYPGFNLRFAKQIKKLGIKILYYVSPQVWAWHKSRLKQIKAYVDHMAVILPFEEDFYKKAQIPASYVGNPVLEQVHKTDRTLAREMLSLSHNAIIVGLIPGSRTGELSRLMPELIDTAEILSRRYPHIQFVIPLANTIKESDIWPYLDGTNLPIMLIKRNSYLAMSAANVLIGSSGTVTLEAAVLGIPMVIIYKMNALTFALAKHLIKIKYIGLPNLLAQKLILPELIQDQANSNAIAHEACRFIDDEQYLARTERELEKVVDSLGQVSTARKVAELTFSLILTDYP
ncbi:MAG: lipid-A-disaccharide synthase [Gammaproteobacteria bacterium]|nr:lipid-A-disaccharide synthase [Gammaproteobacteria bacterium]